MLKQLLMGVAFISRKQLVAAVAGQEHGNAICGRPSGAKVRRKRGRVTKGFFKGLRDFRHCRNDVVGGHIVFVQANTEVSCSNACVRHLIVAFRVKTNGVGIAAGFLNFVQHSGYGRAV